MKPLRIVHTLHHDRVTRGGAIQAMLLARGQREQGHTVEIVCSWSPKRPLDPSFEPWQAEGIPVHPFLMRKTREMLRYRRYLSAFEPDVVHCHRDDALRFTYFATTFKRPPAFISQRGTTHPFVTRTIGFIHRSPRVDRIIAVAHAVKEALVGYGVPEERVEVVYGSFDPSRFDPARADRMALRRELGLASDDELVVQVGELNHKKAPFVFLEAAAEVLKQRPDVTFALVGEGKLEKKCKRLIEELGVTERVRMLGYRRDIPEIYAAANVVTNTSVDYEGLTGAVREALAMARPVVATAVCGNPEVVIDDETGRLVPPNEPDSTARAVIEMLDRPERGARMGQAGRELVVELMHPDVRIARTEEVYRRVLRERTAGRVSTAS